MKNILCFGDSNTYGRIPGVVGPGRYPRDVRWPGILETLLGPGHHVVEEGLGSRTAVMEDYVEGRMSGLSYLVPCLHSHSPLDLVIIQLGTNDMKLRYGLPPVDIALGVERLVKTILVSGEGVGGMAPKVLVLVPLHVEDVGHVKLQPMFEGASKKSRQLAPYFLPMEKNYPGVYVLDVADQVPVSPKDGIHLEAESHRILAGLVAEKVKEILQ